MKYHSIALAGMIAGIVIPFTASAMTMEDIQSQIATLLEQITQLQSQILTLNNAASTSVVPDDVSTEQPSSSAPISCTSLGGEVSPGSRGDSALQLQKFLISQGYLSSDSATGFYGPLTVAAVQMMQKARGVVSQGSPDTTGFGSVGPKTRAAIACKSETGGLCKYITQAQPSTACAAGWQKSLDSNGCQQGWYCPAVESTPVQNSCTFVPPPTTGCDGGSWTANLDYKSCVSGWSCKSITINTNSCPSIAPIYCANGTAQSTGYDSNGCNLGYKCSDATIVKPVVSCPLYSILACNSGYHRGPSSTTANGCTVPGTCVRDGALEAPVVTGVDGPASLNVGQTGTWTVHASVPNKPGAQIRYSVVWGDESPYSLLQGLAAQSSSIPTSSTFTHAYANAATYSPKFTVSNDAGSAQTSSTVSVGATTPNASFSANPTSGTAPFRVYFTAPSGSGVYTVDFGDGSRAQMEGQDSFLCSAAGNPCNALIVDHLYTVPGTYTANLMSSTGTIGSVTIYVKSGKETSNPITFLLGTPFTLVLNQVAENHSEGFYLRLDSIEGAQTATIGSQAYWTASASIVSPGCSGWPSDPYGTIICMFMPQAYKLSWVEGKSMIYDSDYTITAKSVTPSSVTFVVTR